MSKAETDLDALRERNAALQEQLRRLVRTEQRLSISQRELGQQVRRVDALNQYAMRAVTTADPQAIFESAIDMLFSLYPFEQGLGILAGEDGALRPSAVRAVAGREAESGARLADWANTPARLRMPDGACIGSPEEIRARPTDCGTLLDWLGDMYGEPTSGADGPEFALVVPVHGPYGQHRSVIVLRRPEAPLSFHDRLPNEDDRPFLNLVGQTVGVALTNALLVNSLKKSYSDLERTQRELVAQERLAAIGELAAVVAHEVRNPLGVIYNSVAALARIAKPVEKVGPLLDIVREEASRVNRTVADLLEFARPSVLAKHDQALSLIAEDAVASAREDARARGVYVRLEADSDARALVDEHLLRRALLNLIDNATQASREGDTVEVRVTRQECHALIEVEDGGPGIDDDARDRIFEPFFTTKSVGTGLGLAVVKRFAESHGGEVLIRSSPESGSCFTIRLESSLEA